MRLLPHSLWLLIAAHLEAAQAQQASGSPQLPTAIKKMPPDQSEKFHPHYVAFADSNSSPNDPNRPLPVMGFISVEQQQVEDGTKPVLAARRLADEQDARILQTNSSAPLSYRPPFANHNHHLQRPEEEEERAWSLFRRSREALARLQRRQWNCPEGTASCARIKYPNSCCRTSETCVEIEDVGLGKVGCCPAGATCGGSVSTCADGNTGCASEIGGGCCLPGFVCAGVGCIKAGTSPTTTTLPAPTSSDTTAIIPPVRPTSSSSTTTAPPPPPITTTTSPSPTSSTSLDYCPTGFYPCLASAGGGCCQTGRDCSVTNCPPIELSTIINTNGHTIAVPITAVPTTTSATGTCASGWYMCGKEAGPLPGCCPSGYACGSVSCSVVITPTAGGELATATEAKEMPTYAKVPAAPLVGGAAREVVGVEVIVGVAVVVGGMMV